MNACPEYRATRWFVADISEHIGTCTRKEEEKRKYKAKKGHIKNKNENKIKIKNKQV